MKALAPILALAATAAAHYNYPQFIANGVNSTAWQYVRKPNNWQDFNPVIDLSTLDVRCDNTQKLGVASTVSVAAGSTVGFTVNPPIFHQGVLNVYMAKAPAGTDVASWDGSGQVWFKVFQISATTDGGTSINWPAMNLGQVNFKIPAATPSGQYLVRIEHIALHQSNVFQGAQFYISCAQVQVTGGGSGTPGPLVAFPGAYTGNEPGILINIYWPIPTTYVQPGPPVWTGGTGAPAPPATTVRSTTTAPVTTVRSTTVVNTPPATTTSTSGGTVAQFQQCGGSGYAGPTVCVSPFKCTVLNAFYSQCL
ncbi:Lytic polysaccharide monooxygenase [Mycena kentingensis (nom. inval.)]|nr:Lytic polysaccharide monooxygenase [Mycena kentingensis (nom. inval.)]